MADVKTTKTYKRYFRKGYNNPGQYRDFKPDDSLPCRAIVDGITQAATDKASGAYRFIV